MADVGSHRRYCFLKLKRAERDEAYALANAWDGKRRGLPGTALPTTFPALTELGAAGYLVLEEVQGADASELTQAGLSSPQAAAVLAALELLP